MDLKVLESLQVKFLMHGLLVCTCLWMIIMNVHIFPPPVLVCALRNVHFQHLVCLLIRFVEFLRLDANIGIVPLVFKRQNVTNVQLYFIFLKSYLYTKKNTKSQILVGYVSATP